MRTSLNTVGIDWISKGGSTWQARKGNSPFSGETGWSAPLLELTDRNMLSMRRSRAKTAISQTKANIGGQLTRRLPRIPRSEMHGSAVDLKMSNAVKVTVSEQSLSVDLEDGRLVSVPLAWYPRLVYATQAERDNWALIGEGEGIHWPDLDEDLSVRGLIAGWPSQESEKSFMQWLSARQEGRPLTLDALTRHERQQTKSRAKNP